MRGGNSDSYTRFTQLWKDCASMRSASSTTRNLRRRGHVPRASTAHRYKTVPHLAHYHNALHPHRHSPTLTPCQRFVCTKHHTTRVHSTQKNSMHMPRIRTTKDEQTQTATHGAPQRATFSSATTQHTIQHTTHAPTHRITQYSTRHTHRHTAAHSLTLRASQHTRAPSKTRKTRHLVMHTHWGN